MSKGPPITDRVKTLIAEIHNEAPSLYAKEIQVELEKRLKKLRLGEKHRVPQLSFIRGQVRNTKDLSSELDKLFNLGALVKHHILPEAIPTVLRVYVNRAYKDENDILVVESFTVRDAMWVARFSHLPFEPEEIWSFASLYSVRERAYEAMGKLDAIDTTDLDEALIETFIPTAKEGNRILEETENEKS